MDTIEMENPGETRERQAIHEETAAPPLVDGDAYQLRITAPGYIQYVDPDLILNLCQEKDLVIRMLCQPGQFARRDCVVAHVWPASAVDIQLEKQLRRAVQTGTQRTPTQDVEYAIDQLVEVAVRAMSPAINDPFTAETCLDYLADGLATYCQSDETSPNYYDEEGRLRLIFEPPSTITLLGTAFDMLRHASCNNADVLLHMLHTIECIGLSAKSPAVRQELIRHVHLVQMESCAGDLIEPDKERIRLGCDLAEKKLRAASMEALLEEAIPSLREETR